MKSRYERMLDTWAALGGRLPDRSGPAWTWKPYPSLEVLVQLLSHPPIDPTLERIIAMTVAAQPDRGTT